MSEKLPPPEGMMPFEILRDEVKIFEAHFNVVLLDTPFLWFDIDYIKKNREERAFQSPFFEYKDVINKYQGDKMLVIRDFEQKYGEKFLICISKDAADKEIMRVQQEVEEKERIRQAEIARQEEERRKEEELANKVYEDLPIPVKPYVSATADDTIAEVNKLTVTDSRQKFVVNISRKRRDFTVAPAKFNETDADNAAFTFFRQHKDPNFTLVKREVDVGLQDCPGFFSGKSDAKTQTNWFQRVNNTTQYEPIAIGNDVIDDLIAQRPFQNFMHSVRPRLEEALQQNEIIDPFKSDFEAIDAEDDLGLGNKGENVIKELRTFTDLNLSKNMKIPCLDWHPERSSIVAVSCRKPLTFDARVKISGIASNAYIIVWNFADYTPHLVLESPHEITIFKYNPINPNIVAGGCTTGQVIFWDLSAALATLAKGGTERNRNAETPVVRHVYMSSIDKSHRRAVSDLHWIPGTMEIDKDGSYIPSSNNKQNQFISASSDGVLHVWDLRYETVGRRGKKAVPAADGEPISWVPLYSYPLTAVDGVGHLPITKVCLGDLNDGSKFYCGTHHGEIVYADWSNVTEEGNPNHVLWVTRDHHRPCQDLQRSPHFPDVLLSIGDYSFNIWREGQQTPIFTSNISSSTLACGLWSPTRPGVIFIGKSDGYLDIWDLTDQSHKPSVTQPVSNCAVTCMMFRRSGDTAMQQILAVGDEHGNLHMLDVPRNLRRPVNNELSLMTSYIEREVHRVNYAAQRTIARAAETVPVKHEEEHLKLEEVNDVAETVSHFDREEELMENEYKKLEADFRAKFNITTGQEEGGKRDEGLSH